jgi:hypothetical protein
MSGAGEATPPRGKGRPPIISQIVAATFLHGALQDQTQPALHSCSVDRQITAIHLVASLPAGTWHKDRRACGRISGRVSGRVDGWVGE